MAALPGSRRTGSTGALLKTRIPADMKARFGALAKRRGVKKSALIRQLIANALGEHGSSAAETGIDGHRTPEPRRLAFRLNSGDRRALRERARAMNTQVSRYLAALVRAHLNHDFRLLAAETASMRALIAELNTISAGLNHLVHAANEGAVWAGPLKETLEQLLVEFEKLGTALASFRKASREFRQTEVEKKDF